MAQATFQGKVSRRPLAEIVVDRIWRFFCSVRAAVYEIIALVILVLIGTLRGSSVPEWIATHVPATRGIVDRWYAWDVFHSLILILLLTLISVAIAICTINRFPGIWKAIAHPTILTSHGFIRNADINATFTPTRSVQETTEAVTAAFLKRKHRVITAERNGEVHFYADRNKYSKLGTFPFHLALILMLVGGIVGAQYGFREQSFVVAEGSVQNVGHGTGLSVGLTDFKDTYLENGQATEYQSELVVYKDGQAVKSGSITVNHPLSYEGVTIYQSSFGQAISVRITDDQGREIYNDSIPIGLYQSKLNPEAPAGIIDLPIANASFHVIGPDTNPNNMPELDTLNLTSGEVFVQVRPYDLPEGVMPPSSIVGQGDIVQLNGLNVEFLRERQFSLLQVGRNPGMPIFWAASFLLVAGLGVVFYFPHRRIRGIIAPAQDSANGVTASFAPLAKRDWSGQREFENAVDEIARALDVQPVVNRRTSEPDEEAGEDRPVTAQTIT